MKTTKSVFLMRVVPDPPDPDPPTDPDPKPKEDGTKLIKEG